MGCWWGDDASVGGRLLGRAVLAAVVVWTVCVPTRAAAAEVGPGPDVPVVVSSTTMARDTVGLFDPATGRWRLVDGGGDLASFYFGNPGDVPFVGDWDCDGVDTPGLYRRSDGFVYLRNSNTQGVGDVEFHFGNPGDLPVAGDFDGDGCDTVGVYRPVAGRIFLIDRLGTAGGGLGAATRWVALGDPGDLPFAGDLDGDGADEVGVFRPSDATVHLASGERFVFGDPGDVFVAGNWTGTGRSLPAVFRPSTGRFHLATATRVLEGALDGAGGGMIPVSGAFGDLAPDPRSVGAAGNGGDALDLVPAVASLRIHSLGEDRIAVWRCDLTDRPSAGDLPWLPVLLDGAVADWFSTWSQDRYRPVFTVVGRLAASTRIGCLSAVRDATPPGYDGALVVTNDDLSGLASPGPLCFAGFGCDASAYPRNGRVAMVGAGAIAASPATVVHEMGHMLQWPHSRSGVGSDPYDNPMDVMSGAVAGVIPGTVAFNRYQAGWIDPADVVVYRGVPLELTLHAVGDVGPQMLIVPSAVPGRFFTAGARIAGPDDPVPASGVEVYLVDQTCPGSGATLCIGAAGARLQTPAAPDGFGHVIRPGRSAVVGGVEISVVSGDDGAFFVRVAPRG